MVETKKINELVKNDQKVDVFGVIVNMEDRPRKNKPAFLQLTIKDKTGEIFAKNWDKTIKDYPNFAVGKGIKTRATVLDYNGLYLNIEQIRLIQDADGVVLEDLNPEQNQQPNEDTNTGRAERPHIEAVQEPFQAEKPQEQPQTGSVQNKDKEAPAQVQDQVSKTELKIAGLIPGNTVVLFTKIRLMTQGKTKTAQAKPYLIFTFEDATGTVDGKMWETSKEMVPEINSGKIVKIEATCEKYDNGEKSKNQLIVKQIRPVMPEDQINMDDFVKSAPYSGAAMYDKIMTTIETLEPEPLQTLVKTLYEENKDALLVCPGAQLIHHEVKAGLLYHKLTMLQMGQFATQIYPFLNKSVLEAGILVHDLGKLKELKVDEYGQANDYTTSGKLLGHIIEGVKMLALVAQKLNTPEEITTVIEHMIVSHHHDELIGAYQKPMTAEAEVLSMLDLMDARIYQFGEAVEKLEPNTFSDKIWALGQRQVYNPAI